VCRYALTHYKKHYACFACRKAFKRRNKDDVDPAGNDHPARCPECGLLMADMGLDFAPPTTDDARAWSAAASLYEVGETFHSCGCGGPGYRPRDPTKLAAYFEERVAEYRRHLAAWVGEEHGDAARASVRDAAIASWRSRLEKVEAALGRVRKGR
jgi:DNA-directed RNA polymerase subunit RPC12/RpoP